MSQPPVTTQELILRRIRDIPSLPAVVDRITELLVKPNTPASQIAELISYDPGLTTRVLRMVNSAAYGFQRQISSIQHGIMILGFNTVRGLVLSTSIVKLFEGQSRPMGLDHKAFWKHSMATATAARIIGNHLRLPDIDDAFSAGILHDIGKIVLDVYFSPRYQDVIAEMQRQHLAPHGAAFLDIETRILGTSHTEIGGMLASKWKLPVTITEVIQYHHAPEKAELCQPLVYLIALANEMARMLTRNHGIFTAHTVRPELLEYFNLQESQLEGLYELLKEEMASIEELLNTIAA